MLKAIRCAADNRAFLALVSTVVMLLGCADARGPAALSGEPGVEAGAAPSVVVTVELALVVEDVDRATRLLRKLVSRYRGRVAGGSSEGVGETRQARFELRVPSATLEPFRLELCALGAVETETERAEEVTAARADVGARLRNARAHERRLLELLEAKTTSVADLVALEGALFKARESLERLEAEHRVMEDRIADATVQVVFRRARPQLWASPVETISRGLGVGIVAAGNLLVGAGFLGAAALPSLLLIAALALLCAKLAGLARRGRRRTRDVGGLAQSVGDERTCAKTS